MPERREDPVLRRAQAHLRRICGQEEGRDDAAATYSLIATHLLALSLKLQSGSPGNLAARRFMHGVMVQFRDDLQRLGIDLDEVVKRPGMTG